MSKLPDLGAKRESKQDTMTWLNIFKPVVLLPLFIICAFGLAGLTFSIAFRAFVFMWEIFGA